VDRQASLAECARHGRAIDGDEFAAPPPEQRVVGAQGDGAKAISMALSREKRPGARDSTATDMH
jgi:hypothetical protein